MKHTDLIRVCAQNKKEAKDIVKKFLECYQKKDVIAVSATGSDGYFEVFAFYTDEYDDCPIFKSSDYKEDETEQEMNLTMKIQNI